MNAHLDAAESLELIICDYGSTDGIKEEIENDYPKLTYLYVKPNEGEFLNMAKCLNAGCFEARNPVIAPFGVDMRINKRTIDKICRIFFTLRHVILRPIMIKFDKDDKATEISYTPYLMNREDILKLGGWDERMVGWGREDDDLMERGMKYADLMEMRVRAFQFGYGHKWHNTFFTDETDNRNYDENPNTKYAKENAQNNGKNLVNSYWIRQD